MDRGAWWTSVHGVKRIRYNLVTKQQQSHIYKGLIQLNSIQTNKNNPINKWVKDPNRYFPKENILIQMAEDSEKMFAITNPQGNASQNHSVSSYLLGCVRMHTRSLPLCVTLRPHGLARQAPLSMGLSRQECWSGLPCPPPEDLLDPGIEPVSLMSPALASGFFTTSATWETPK